MVCALHVHASSSLNVNTQRFFINGSFGFITGAVFFLIPRDSWPILFAEGVVMKLILFILLSFVFNSNAYSAKKIDNCLLCEEKCATIFKQNEKTDAGHIKYKLSKNKNLILERSGDFILNLYKDDTPMDIIKETVPNIKQVQAEQLEDENYIVKHYYNIYLKGDVILRIRCYCCDECRKICL